MEELDLKVETMSVDKTAKGVFDKAIYLINENNESTGATQTTDTKEYEVRTVGILNSLLDEVYPASDNFVANEDGTRPAIDDITALSDVIDLDARIVRNVLPYGLAARLLSEENPTLANFFQQCYETALSIAAVTIPKEFEEVDNPYGGFC